MTRSLPQWIVHKFTDDDNKPLAGGLVYTKIAGSDDPAPTYTEVVGGDTNSNPIVLDANGQCRIVFDDDYVYKLVVSGTNVAVPYSIDNIVPIGAGSAVSEYKVKVNSSDTIGDYFFNKLTLDENITGEVIVNPAGYTIRLDTVAPIPSLYGDEDRITKFGPDNSIVNTGMVEDANGNILLYGASASGNDNIVLDDSATLVNSTNNTVLGTNGANELTNTQESIVSGEGNELTNASRIYLEGRDNQSSGTDNYIKGQGNVNTGNTQYQLGKDLVSSGSDGVNIGVGNTGANNGKVVQLGVDNDLDANANSVFIGKDLTAENQSNVTIVGHGLDMTGRTGRQGVHIGSGAGQYVSIHGLVTDNYEAIPSENQVLRVDSSGFLAWGDDNDHTHAISSVVNLQTELDGKEDSFTKNTAFNKNFGASSGTIAQGNDSRILNGQTAYGWGDHSGQYLPLTGGILTGDLTINGTAYSDTIISKTTDTDLTLAGKGTGIVKLSSNLDLNGSNLVANGSIVSGGSANVYIDDDLEVTGDLGLNGSTPVSKGVITGSRSENAALASLLTYLASRGDLTDSTTI